MEEKQIEMEELKSQLSSQEMPDDLPLFIKIDRYHSLLSIVDEMRHFSNVIEEIEATIRQIENLRSKAEDLLSRTRSDLMDRVKELDSMLVKPKGYVKKTQPAREIEETLSELRREIEDLKRSLGMEE